MAGKPLWTPEPDDLKVAPIAAFMGAATAGTVDVLGSGLVVVVPRAAEQRADLAWQRVSDVHALDHDIIRAHLV